jgi:calcium-dependent protein kinase
MGNCSSSEDGREPEQERSGPARGGTQATQQHKEQADGGSGGAVGGGPAPANSKSVLARWEDVRESYVFDKILGRGQFGVTRLVTHRTTHERAACKSISKRK